MQDQDAHPDQPRPPIDIGILVEDEGRRKQLEGFLKDSEYSIDFADPGRHAGVLFRGGVPRVVLCDDELSGATGIERCRELRRQEEFVGAHFLLLCGDHPRDWVTAALDSGVDDFLTKPVTRESLMARLRVGLRTWGLQNQLRRAATLDSLTGLLNHDAFHQTLANELSRSRRFGRPVALMMLDIDFFKAVNDSFGHPVGNAALQAVAGLLREGLRGCDAIGRLGGEEFGIVLPEAVCADAAVVAERLRLSVRESLSVPDLRGHVLTVSVGVADSEDARATGAAQLVDLADRTLYLAKRRGRDRVIRADELDDGPDWTLEIRGDEIEALRRRLAVLSARAKDVYVQSVASLLQALNEKDPYTAHHALNVAFYAQQMAEEHGCSAGTVRGIYNAALLHDIGKVGVPDRILMKATSLDRTERMVIEQVPLIGTRIVDHLRILEAEVQIIRHQHEYFDGGGRPAGLAGGRIPIGSRILLAADAFDAMTTDRIYRHRRSMDEAVAELDRLAGTQFDPRVVRSLHQILERNRPLWQQRIDDTVRAMQLPTDVVLGTASGL